MNKKISIIIFAAIILAATAYFILRQSGHSRLHINIDNVEKSVTVKHFDDAFFTSDTLLFNQALGKLKTEYPPFFAGNNPPDFWINQRLNQSQRMLYADWKKQLSTYSHFDAQLEDAFKHLYFYYPDIPEFTAYTYISNLDFDYPILLAQDFIFIGVDNYLGQNHPAYINENSYQNYARQKAFIINDVMNQFAQNLAMKDLDDNTLLNEMIWWGKQTYFKQAMQPLAHDTIIARMSRQHQEFCLENERNIWTFFIDNQLLFDTNENTKRVFIAPAPFSKFGMPFDSETPGMIGRWLGWRIVASYMANNPHVSLPELMANTDYKLIFKNSKYKP